MAGRLHLARVELAWLRGDADAARQILAEAPRSIGIWASPVDAWRAVWRARLDGEAPAVPVPPPAAADPALHRALDAELAAEGAGRRNGVSANLWGQAVGGWSAIGRPYETAWAQLRQAEAGFAGADRATAKAALHEAATVADRLGAAPLAARAEDVARRARVSARPIHREIADPSTLTEREHDVLGLLSDGRTNRQIGELLFLSPKTVGIHVSRILDKLDAATRGEAVAAARRGGLLE